MEINVPNPSNHLLRSLCRIEMARTLLDKDPTLQDSLIGMRANRIAAMLFPTDMEIQMESESLSQNERGEKFPIPLKAKANAAKS